MITVTPQQEQKLRAMFENMFADVREPKIEAKPLTQEKRVQIERTWRERLFTRPWTPFTRHRTVIEIEPSWGIMRFANVFVLRPEIARIERDVLAARETGEGV